MAAGTSDPSADPSAAVTGTAGRMPLVEHLRELRDRLAWSLGAVAVCVVVAYVFWEPLFDVLKEPYTQTPQGQADPQLTSFSVFEQFAVRLRVSFLVGVVAASPVWLYQLGAFITPALHRKERRYAGSFLAAALLLFVVGAVLAYLTVSKGLTFLLQVGGDGVESQLRIGDYLDFLTLTLLAFGVAFEFPVVVTFLNVVGVFPSATMRSWRRGMVVGLTVFAAVITPSQDPIGMAVLAASLYLLYEMCILLARLRERSARKRRARDPVARLADDDTSAIDATPTRVDPVESHVDPTPSPLDEGRPPTPRT